jgi:hypothetical protein
VPFAQGGQIVAARPEMDAHRPNGHG